MGPKSEKHNEMKQGCRFNCGALSFTMAVCLFLFFVSRGFAQAAFYQGKTITVIQGREPGGTGDLRARAITQFLQKYIPGNPTIVHEYMGGGGRSYCWERQFWTA
jgi:tripartite-type tricarboxylate transporter receptor subunit TctC